VTRPFPRTTTSFASAVRPARPDGIRAAVPPYHAPRPPPPRVPWARPTTSLPPVPHPSSRPHASARRSPARGGRDKAQWQGRKAAARVSASVPTASSAGKHSRRSPMVATSTTCLPRLPPSLLVLLLSPLTTPLPSLSLFTFAIAGHPCPQP
jgi:hypothetical protein